MLCKIKDANKIVLLLPKKHKIEGYFMGQLLEYELVLFDDGTTNVFPVSWLKPIKE